jgi:two-component system phosphate regulon sensor histidine kinase PhoR
VHANADAHRMLQHQPAEARDLRSWRDTEAYHLDGRRLQPDEWPLARTLATGEVVNGEKYEVVLGGRRGILEISTAPIVSADGELTGALAIFQDVSTQEQSERAERDFVTNAAHELQSPLAAIVSAIEVLQAGAKDGPQRDVFLGHIERAADRLARLVRALLILARTQSGLEAPRDELVALCPLLAEVSSVLTLSPAVELELDCPDDLAVVTNRELVEQALVNLAENAAKQTRTGRILLRARESPGARVEVTVADTGPGIPATDRLRVFERFYRSDRSPSQGFGLGLAIVRAVADALEGEVELDSAPGAGTTVTLRIPNAASMVTR